MLAGSIINCQLVTTNSHIRHREQLMDGGLTEEEVERMEELRMQAVALEASLRRLHEWGALEEEPGTTWRREEVREEGERRYHEWWSLWRKFEEGEGEAQRADDRRRMEKAELRRMFGHDVCILCWR